MSELCPSFRLTRMGAPGRAGLPSWHCPLLCWPLGHSVHHCVRRAPPALSPSSRGRDRDEVQGPQQKQDRRPGLSVPAECGPTPTVGQPRGPIRILPRSPPSLAAPRHRPVLSGGRVPASVPSWEQLLCAVGPTPAPGSLGPGGSGGSVELGMGPSVAGEPLRNQVPVSTRGRPEASGTGWPCGVEPPRQGQR